MSTKETVRTVKAKAERHGNQELWNLIVQCPYCLGTHTHGAGAVALAPSQPAAGFYGMRAAHCEGGYYILERGK